MKLIIDINKKDYNSIISDKLISPRNLNIYERIIANGTPLEEELEQIKAEFEEDRYILLNQTVAIQVIDKHISELKGE